jgi:serine/threonine protein kinase
VAISPERFVALKRLWLPRMQSAQAVERFHREVKAAARLEHPNMLTAYHAGEAEDVHFLVMQYVAEFCDILGQGDHQVLVGQASRLAAR